VERRDWLETVISFRQVTGPAIVSGTLEAQQNEGMVQGVGIRSEKWTMRKNPMGWERKQRKGHCGGETHGRRNQ
jgi:hypothetical protein